MTNILTSDVSSNNNYSNALLEGSDYGNTYCRSWSLLQYCRQQKQHAFGANPTRGTRDSLKRRESSGLAKRCSLTNNVRLAKLFS